MDNEVVIKVKADNAVAAGFNAAKREAKSFGDDLVKVGKKAGTELAALGPKIGGGLADGLTSSLGPVGGKMVGVLAVGAIAAAPMLGAALSAAVVGGAAGVGVIGGLALAAKDPRVKSAGAALGQELMKSLENKAEIFVEPALRGIDRVRAGWQKVGPDIDKIFANSAKFVDPLVNGLVSGGQRAIKGIATAISRAGPIVDAFSYMIDELGGAVGELFEELSEDPEASARGFRELTDMITGTIGVVGDLTSHLVKTYDALAKTDDEIDNWRHSLEDALSIQGGPEFDITADGMSNVERKAKEAAEANRELADSHKEAARGAGLQRDQLQELASELRAQTDPVFALLDAETELGEARTKYNKAVIKYGENSAEARDELNAMARAAIDVQAATGELGDTFNGELTPALKATLRAANWTESEIAALGREFMASKRKGDAFAKTYRARVVTEYISRYSAVVTSSAQRAYEQTKAGRATGGIKGAASGMVTGDLTWVGERGPELVNLPTGSTVRSSGDSMRMMRDGQRAAGIGDGRASGGVLKVEADRTLENTLIGVLLSALRLEIGGQGGDVQQVLGRSVR